mmetsp:Transcript_28885/g.84430  ORF Transcript_28885/g.84430 Transcript_28885/m.84430 type:complete len:90 (+) Transcript_28885:1411-1680(+)
MCSQAVMRRLSRRVRQQPQDAGGVAKDTIVQHGRLPVEASGLALRHRSCGLAGGWPVLCSLRRGKFPGGVSCVMCVQWLVVVSSCSGEM